MSNVLEKPAAPVRAERRPVALRGSAAAHQQWAQGVALVGQGRHEQAVVHFERASRLSPRVPLYWLNLANVLRRQMRSREAIAAARRAFELDPADAIACRLLADLLHGANRNAEAFEVLRGLDPATPRDVDHNLLLAAVLTALKRWQDLALVSLDVLVAKPADGDAYMRLGYALKHLRRYADAAECFRTLALLDPAHISAAGYAAHFAAWACDWKQAKDDVQRLEQAFELQTPEVSLRAFCPFTLVAMNDDAAMHRRGAEMESLRLALVQRRSSPRKLPREHARARAALAAGRIRIGFASPDFRLHATTLLLVQTLERLPRDRFEVFLYSHGEGDGTAQRQRVVAAADHFVECGEMDATEQAERIEDDGIALLVDLSGHTAQTRLGVFALRPAPLQVPWLAYPGTTGADFMDYLVGDPTVTPLEHAADFSEKIAQLPLTYQPTDERREHPEPSSRAEAGLPE
ncbi:MAG: tetratricopeptide repeat protein, partial [Burkholderiales bacterium]|nr:tetratricopeptide repeat protein [Burkholderiales bacterium]